MFTYEYMQHTVIVVAYGLILILDCFGIGYWIYMAIKGIKYLAHWIKGKIRRSHAEAAATMEGGETHESL
jgi:hypothetical protein